MPTTLYWEIQSFNSRTGLWAWKQGNPAGGAQTELSADAFAHKVADENVRRTTGKRRIVVWDATGVGKLPVAMLEYTRRREG